jgi:hypothetical protein
MVAGRIRTRIRRVSLDGERARPMSRTDLNGSGHPHVELRIKKLEVRLHGQAELTNTRQPLP